MERAFVIVIVTATVAFCAYVLYAASRLYPLSSLWS